MCMLVKLAPNHTHWMKKVMKIPKIFGYKLRIYLYCEDNREGDLCLCPSFYYAVIYIVELSLSIKMSILTILTE